MTGHALLTAAAVRQAAARMLADGRAGRLLHWRLNEDALPDIARLVARVTRQNYPDLAIPFHARWRHFSVDGVDRWQALAATLPAASPLERLRRAFDLVILSVLMDAGTGGAWSYFDAATQRHVSSSEGLALASLDLYRTGVAQSKYHALEAAWLAALDTREFEAAFQVRLDNPLSGVEGRVALLNRLGEACLARPELFAADGPARPGGLAGAIAARAGGHPIEASVILEMVLEAFGPIWPSRLAINGVGLGDSWRYAPWGTGDAAIVPFHKLSQWLTYSLIEPLELAGIAVANAGALTGLAEYRNGGLFVDGGALDLRDPADTARAHEPSSPLVVEWRALTVALLDLLRPMAAAELGLAAAEFPLPRLLEGGTWAAGRQLARQKRGGGNPPVAIVSDGTVF